MKTIEIRVPSVGKDFVELTAVKVLKKTGDRVEKEETFAEFDSDKCLIGIHAEEAGIITIEVKEGQVYKVGDLLGTIRVIPTKIAIQREIAKLVLEGISKKSLLEVSDMLSDIYMHDEECKSIFEDALEDFQQDIASRFGLD